MATTHRESLFTRLRDGVRAERYLPAPVLLPALGLLLIAALSLGVGVGAVALSPAAIVAVLLGKAGVALNVVVTLQQATILWSIRLPRVLLGALIGAGLAVSGALLQGVLRNPLADPGLIGVSSGAALGAVAVIVLGLAPLGLLTLPSPRSCAAARRRCWSTGWRGAAGAPMSPRCCWSGWR